MSHVIFKEDFFLNLNLQSHNVNISNTDEHESKPYISTYLKMIAIIVQECLRFVIEFPKSLVKGWNTFTYLMFYLQYNRWILVTIIS